MITQSSNVVPSGKSGEVPEKDQVDPVTIPLRLQQGGQEDRLLSSTARYEMMYK